MSKKASSSTGKSPKGDLLPLREVVKHKISTSDAGALSSKRGSHRRVPAGFSAHNNPLAFEESVDMDGAEEGTAAEIEHTVVAERRPVSETRPQKPHKKIASGKSEKHTRVDLSPVSSPARARSSPRQERVNKVSSEVKTDRVHDVSKTGNGRQIGQNSSSQLQAPSSKEVTSGKPKKKSSNRDEHTKTTLDTSHPVSGGKSKEGREVDDAFARTTKPKKERSSRERLHGGTGSAREFGGQGVAQRLRDEAVLDNGSGSMETATKKEREEQEAKEREEHAGAGQDAGIRGLGSQERHGSLLVYNEETGQLCSNLTGGATSAFQVEGRPRRTYIEATTDGTFHRIDVGAQGAAGLWDWLVGRRWAQPPLPQASPDATAGASGEADTPSFLHSLSERVGMLLNLTAIISHCLLGGFALMNLYMSFLVHLGDLQGGFLHYYSPISVSCQRTYISLTSISLLAASDQYARDKLMSWHPRGKARQQQHDIILIMVYSLAFFLSILGSPFEDLINYANSRVPGWYADGMRNKGFKRNLNLWHALNAVRLLACGIGFFLVTYDLHARKQSLMLECRAEVESRRRQPVSTTANTGHENHVLIAPVTAHVNSKH